MEYLLWRRFSCCWLVRWANSHMNGAELQPLSVTAQEPVFTTTMYGITCLKAKLVSASSLSLKEWLSRMICSTVAGFFGIRLNGDGAMVAATLAGITRTCSLIKFEGFFEPLRKELGIILVEPEKITVQNVGCAVVSITADNAPARLEDGHDGLQDVPVSVLLHLGGDLPVTEVWVRHFGDDLPAGQIVIKAETFGDAG